MKSVLLAIVVAFLQDPSPRVGIIAGAVMPPAEAALKQPVQVVLLSPQYVDLWNSDVQRRLDVLWERYKPAFAQKKDFFYEVSRMAHRDATQFVVNRMRRDMRNNVSAFVQESSAEGKFEFKNIPFGEYKVVALGKVGEQELIWQESVDVNSPIPQFLELKKRLP